MLPIMQPLGHHFRCGNLLERIVGISDKWFLFAKTRARADSDVGMHFPKANDRVWKAKKLAFHPSHTP
jgi:hypothetical protein